MKKLISLVLAELMLFQGVALAAPQSVPPQNPPLPQINLITNGTFEAAKAGWTASSPTTFTIETGSPLFGKASAKFVPTATSQTLTTAQYAVPVGLQGAPCSAQIFYKTAETTNAYTLQVIDGSSNVLASVALGLSVSTAQPAQLYFSCPSSSTVALQVVSSGSASALYLDNVQMGRDLLVQVSQANFFGGVQWDWNSGVADNTTYADFSNSSYTSSNPKGACAASASGLGCTADFPAGEYIVQVTGALSCRDAGGNNAFACQIGIGDTAATPIDYGFISANQPSGSTYGMVVPSMQFHVSYSTSGVRTLRLQGGGVGLADHAGAGDAVQAASHLVFKIYRFPTASEQAVRADSVNWIVDVTQTGNNIGLPTSTGSSGLAVLSPASGLSLTLNTGSSSAYEPCSGGNAPTSPTGCSAGTTEGGLAFNLPQAGSVLVCANFAVALGETTSPSIVETFDLVETSTTSETPIQSANLNMNINEQLPNTSSTSRFMSGCSTMKFSSSGLKVLRLAEQYSIISGSLTQHLVLADGSQGRAMHWTIRPITAQTPVPLFVGNVTNLSSGVEHIERATVQMNQGSSSVISESGSWLSFSSYSSPRTSFSFQAGEWSSTPSCTCTVHYSGASTGTSNIHICEIQSSTNSGITLVTTAASGAEAFTSGFFADIICMGPK